MNGLALRIALRLYPKRWRERYGTEVVALNDELVAAGHASRFRADAGLISSALAVRLSSRRRSSTPMTVAGLGVLLLAAALAAAFRPWSSGSTPGFPSALPPDVDTVTMVGRPTSADVLAIKHEMILRGCRVESERSGPFGEVVPSGLATGMSPMPSPSQPTVVLRFSFACATHQLVGGALATTSGGA